MRLFPTLIGRQRNLRAYAWNVFYRVISAGLLVVFGVSAAQSVSPFNPAQRETPDNPSPDDIALPMTKLADSLEKSGRSEAARITRQWIPRERPDSTVVYFSDLEKSIPDEALAEPKVEAAFLRAREETAALAITKAKQYAEQGAGFSAYRMLWRAVREDPEAEIAGKILGLPLNRERIAVSVGRNAPRHLAWPDRSFQIVQSPHFRILSTAPRREATQLCNDLERFLEVWSQVFVPLWLDEKTICAAILQGTKLPSPTRPLEIVLFAKRAHYVDSLTRNGVQGASLSTGFYSPESKQTFLFLGADADSATRYHEVTHQLLQELAVQAVLSPGLDSGFWIVEGIACYMESLRFLPSYATLGGWESNQLQFARGRYLNLEPPPSLDTLMPMGRDEVQKLDNLGSWYTLVAAYTHLLMDDPAYQPQLIAYLQSVYRGKPRSDLIPSTEASDWPSRLARFLRTESGSFPPLHPGTQLSSLCLGNTGCSAEFVRSLPQQSQLKWLDLAGIEVDSQDVVQLAGATTTLERLNLERTSVDASLGTWVSNQKQLEELDISFTAIDDGLFQSLERLPKLRTLWATGSRLSDSSVPRIITLRSLQQLDVQRTKITNSELERIRAAFPQLQLNPLQLVSPQAP
jgi:hypothetical protein